MRSFRGGRASDWQSEWIRSKRIKIGAGQSSVANGSEIVHEGQDALWLEDNSAAKSAAQRKKR